jgi:hypothetical protein
MGCVTWFLLVAASVLTLATIVRWFEQVTEAVDQRWWNKVIVLILVPPAVWLFPSRISAGRPTAVPHHEPVRGFGTVPIVPKEARAPASEPPPGTPKEFIGLPQIPSKKRPTQSAVDPDKLAKLKQKMKEQGMLDDDA